MKNLMRLVDWRYATLLALLPLLSLGLQAQTTTRNVKVERLGTGAGNLIKGDLTDPENDGEDALGAATSPTWNWAEIDSSHEQDFEGGENAFNVFDNKVGGGNDKWCCDDPTPDNPVWIAVKFRQAVSLTHFTVTSGNDTPTRDPTHWAIQGSNDGVTYTDIYRFIDSVVPWTARNQVVKFTLPFPSQAYLYIRYIAYDTPAPLHQINELEYFGSTTVPADTDGDGIIDAAETFYGFNPNNASDAAQDFDKDGISNLNEYKAGSDPVDVTKPTLLSVASTSSFDKVILTFSEDLDPATANAAANYTLSPSLAVTAASYNQKVVTLTTAKQTPGATAYTVTVKGVTDTSKNEVPASSSGLFYSYTLTRTGVLRFAYWTGITGTPVDNLLGDPNYPNSPTAVGAIYSFNSRDIFPTDSLDNYGAVIDGYITPTESASYDFFLRSDDASQLYLSTDEKEANLSLIAEETGCCGAFMEPSTGDAATTSTPIALVAGRKYFIRVIYKEGGGGDFAQVAWRKTTDKTPAASLLPIPGLFISAAEDLAVPAEGAYTTQSPGPNAANVKPGAPVTIAHRDGKTAWTASNVTLKIDGAEVKPTVTKVGNLATIEYKPTTLFASKSTHTITLGYLDPAGQPATLDWSFSMAEYKGPVKDKVKGYDSFILGSANLTPDKGGVTGNAGDYAIDFGRGSGQSVLIPDASFLNAAAAGDKMTFALWVKKYDIANNSAFWADSPSSSGSERGFQGHTPWSDNTVYFDTSGCCAGGTQRISSNISNFPDYSGDISWWTNNWHHFAFVKNAGHKQIWINGKILVEGDNEFALPTDFARIWLGAQGGGPNTGTANNFHGLQDDFAVFGSALTEADIKKLAAKETPSSLSASANLTAYWDFNGALPTEAPKFSKISRAADGKITVEWTGGGTLEAAAAITGPWQAVPGATSPYTFTPSATQLFGRIRQ